MHLLWIRCFIASNSQAEVLTLPCDGIWRRGFGTQSGCEGGALVNRISALIKGTPECPLSAMRGCRRGLSSEPDHAGWQPDLELPCSRLQERNCYCFKTTQSIVLCYSSPNRPRQPSTQHWFGLRHILRAYD